MSEAMVSLDEIATAMGRKPDQVEAEARAVGLTVRPDWAGRPALTVDEARGLASGAAKRHAAREAAWARHQADTKRWIAGRDRAVAEAARAVRAKAGTRGSGSVSLQARNAAVEAGMQYEKHTPRPSFNGIYSVHLEYVEEVSA